MEKLFQIIFKIIKTIMMILATIIELPIKILVVVSLIVIFILCCFVMPLVNKIDTALWWERYVEYGKSTKLIIFNWIGKNYQLYGNY